MLLPVSQSTSLSHRDIGEEVNVLDSNGETALPMAARVLTSGIKEMRAVVTLLAKSGAFFDMKNDQGVIALHLSMKPDPFVAILSCIGQRYQNPIQL